MRRHKRVSGFIAMLLLILPPPQAAGRLRRKVAVVAMAVMGHACACGGWFVFKAGAQKQGWQIVPIEVGAPELGLSCLEPT